MSWVGRKVLLREIDSADRRTLVRFDRETARGHSPQLGGYRHWAAHRGGAADAGDNFQVAIESLHGRALVGSLSTAADPLGDRFSYGIGIGVQHRRCGYAGDAIVVLLTYMFGQRRYRRCEVSIYGGNLASLSLHGTLGFREEGRVPDTELLHGGIKRLVQMSITAQQFAALNPIGAVRAPVRSVRGRHWQPRSGRHRPAQRLR
ncbi:MAG: GNAT family N-acetyltransferase [Actinomycetes bacterium]